MLDKVYTIDELISRNHSISDNLISQDPNYFKKHLKIKEPKYMWIGCSDYRVPPEQILGVGPGDVFVHRCVGNILNQDDTLLMGFLYIGLKVFNIKKVIICGHHDCALVSLSLKNEGSEMPYVCDIKSKVDEIKHKHIKEINAIEDEHDQLNFLIDKNVLQQVDNLKNVEFVQPILKDIEVAGVIYDIASGKLKKIC